MNYFEEIDAWLSAILLAIEDDDNEEQWFLRVKKAIKAKILESYRNGQKAGLKPKPMSEDEREARPAKKFWPRRGTEGR